MILKLSHVLGSPGVPVKRNMNAAGQLAVLLALAFHRGLQAPTASELRLTFFSKGQFAGVDAGAKGYHEKSKELLLAKTADDGRRTRPSTMTAIKSE